VKIYCVLLLLLSNSFAGEHPYESPYECLTKRTSKRSGKTYTTLNLIHPAKNLLIKLSGVKKKGTFKVANLYAPEGRYDGSYKGIYPNHTNIKFLTFWPNKNARVIKLLSKVDKSNCKKTSDSSIFNLTYLGSLECMDPKSTGSCKSLGR
jgi:hypothetical protein